MNSTTVKQRVGEFLKSWNGGSEVSHICKLTLSKRKETCHIFKIRDGFIIYSKAPTQVRPLPFCRNQEIGILSPLMFIFQTDKQRGHRKFHFVVVKLQKGRERIYNYRFSKQREVRAYSSEEACLKFSQAEGNINTILLNSKLITLGTISLFQRYCN